MTEDEMRPVKWFLAAVVALATIIGGSLTGLRYVELSAHKCQCSDCCKGK